MPKTFQDFFLSCKECVLENPRSFYGSFSLGPFKNSQSLTIANALRRILLTEISNIAITHVEIDGVLHEYSTIEGVRESVLDILLHFKQIVLKTSIPLNKPVYGYLNVRGPGILRVSDLKLPPNIQYVDPDQYIATLNENGNLSLKFTISDFQNSFLLKNEKKSQIEKNFDLNSINKAKTNFLVSSLATSEKRRNFQKTNSLWVDPNFNAILKVNYLIENLEPTQQSFQNQIIHVEIWTNGSIHPRKALYLTFDFLKNILNKFDDMKQVNFQFHKKFFESEETLNKILKSYEYDFGFYDVLSSKKKLNVFSNEPQFLQNITSSNLKVATENFFENKNLEKNSFLPIEKLNLPLRITQCLIQKNLLTIQDLLNFDLKELQNFCGLGNFSLFLIQKKLKKLGFFLKTEKEI